MRIIAHVSSVFFVGRVAKTPMKTVRQKLDPVETAGSRKFCKARPLAARFGICTRTLFRFADRGHIHRFKLNPRLVVFDEAEVAAYFDSARVASGWKPATPTTLRQGGGA